MDDYTQDRLDDSPIEELESLHRRLFPPLDESLRRIVAIQRERRLARESAMDTVVTYGAYEKPI